MKRPTSVTLIGTVFIIAGCLSAAQMVYGLLHHAWNLNFAVLMAPVGFGLLKGRASSRLWAKLWIGLISLMFGLLLICYPFFGDTYTVAWPEEQLTGFQRHAVAVGLPTVILLIAWWMWRSLTSPSATAYFEEGLPGTKYSKPYHGPVFDPGTYGDS